MKTPPGPTELTSIAEEIRATKGALTIPRLAQLLNMSPRSLYDHVDRGTLPAYRIGTSVRLDPKATADWLQARSTRPSCTTQSS
jgi:excisionase family DNA binding protein